MRKRRSPCGTTRPRVVRSDTPVEDESATNEDIAAMIRVGGSPYYLLKLANFVGMDVQDVGAQQTGLTRAEFQARLLAAAQA